MNMLITISGNYQPINKKNIESREEFFKNAKILYTITNNIIEAFKDGTF